ncbi:alpha/beta-hydrolase [Dacryopinax primogenitus]|uniref:Alpha/beta-hydrolase n=1 Tax=Dacryopinax primogenitus (strain DJM 731) TaxID=1858805 RepID=M5FN59_DACPD|nr:alpha/beta-hydrolase [Dacryopinax primogenitus]EJT96875.1 alpha/beta-hydrolase [Dacryopinax primogenitus]
MTTLNTTVALRIGPLLLDTLFKHYLERKTVTKDSKAREELLYDAAFTTFRAFMEAATKHSVEELQQFSNVRFPAPPWVHLVRLRIPLSSCNQAAQYLITAFGGEEKMRTFVGGVKWWQARGLEGIDAQWVCSKKDLEREEKALRERKREATLGIRSPTLGPNGASGTGVGQKDAEKTGSGSGTLPGETGEEAVYSSGMDSMRCLLYLHGGGYYFGSVDQERYTMQRYARKMKGRCFAVDYRLAPQYPFPCALQDCIAAYLYLIRPPPGASHAPIPPNRIIMGGDSAGGGLVLGLLQILRDTGLPLPGGAVLISPWCDLTHSFPSVFQNTATDIVPSYGLSIHKPSTLWPPPPEDLSSSVRTRIRERILEIVRPPRSASPDHTHFTQNEEGVVPPHRTRRHSHSSQKSAHSHISRKSQETLTVRGDTRLPPHYHEDPEAGSALHPHDPLPAHIPTPGPEEPAGKPLSSWDPTQPGPITLTVDGREATIRSQVQLYCTNHQLTHPLVSPCLGYLGGLCPLLVIASDKEVLRDEIIYIAHKAARPDQYPLKDQTRKLYPHLEGIEKRYGPTPVHLQVYDETSHVLPLISFSTPAKYCYRAIAAFCVHVTPGGVPSPTSPFPEPSELNSATYPPRSATLDGLPEKQKKRADMHIDVDGLPWILPESPLASTPEEEEETWLAERSGEKDKEEKDDTWLLVNSPDAETRKETELLLQSPETEAGSSRDTTMGLPHPLSPLEMKPGNLTDITSGKDSEASADPPTEDRPEADLSEVSNSQSIPSASTDPPAIEMPAPDDPLPPVLPASTSAPEHRKTHFPKLMLHDSSKARESGRAFTFPAHLLRSMSSAPDKHKTQSDLKHEDGHTDGRAHLVMKHESKQASEDVAGPRFGAVPDDSLGRKAGDASVYQMKDLIVDNMIRERVSRTGTIRPLEPPSELPACEIALADIGVIKENAAKRYLHGQALWDKKFASTVRSVEKNRIKHLKRAGKDADRRASLYVTGKVNHRTLNDEDPTWGWGWAVDGEDPPPSSIVARRDTHEARHLARIADKSWQEDAEDDKWAGNRLWTQLADWLTGPGDTDNDNPFAEANSNKALDSLRKRETLPSSTGQEQQPNGQPTVIFPDKTGSAAPGHSVPDGVSPKSHTHKSTLNPFSKFHGSDTQPANSQERKPTLNIFRHLQRKGQAVDDQVPN